MAGAALRSRAVKLLDQCARIGDGVEGLRPHRESKRLRAAADLLTDTLLSHLAYEERELVEPLARPGFL